MKSVATLLPIVLLFVMLASGCKSGTSPNTGALANFSADVNGKQFTPKETVVGIYDTVSERDVY